MFDEMVWAFESYVGDPIEKLALIRLCDGVGDPACPHSHASVEEVAKFCNVEVGYAQQALEGLQQKGFIIKGLSPYRKGETVFFLNSQREQHVPRETVSKYPSWPEWNRLRQVVFERDGFACSYCGAEGVPLHCDHVIPISRGGTHDIENLKTACKPCNSSKGSKTLDEWER